MGVSGYCCILRSFEINELITYSSSIILRIARALSWVACIPTVWRHQNSNQQTAFSKKIWIRFYSNLHTTMDSQAPRAIDRRRRCRLIERRSSETPGRLAVIRKTVKNRSRPHTGKNRGISEHHCALAVNQLLLKSLSFKNLSLKCLYRNTRIGDDFLPFF